jgi:hypothetical protein
MVSTISSWFSHPALLWGLGIFSVVAVVASVLLVPRYLASLPPDYLVNDAKRDEGGMAWRIARNALGVVLVLLGIAMLLLPGQGLITLLVGVLLVDFPGKQKLVRRLLGRPKVLRVVNKMREKRGSAPLTLTK